MRLAQEHAFYVLGCLQGRLTAKDPLVIEGSVEGFVGLCAVVDTFAAQSAATAFLVRTFVVESEMAMTMPK